MANRIETNSKNFKPMIDLKFKPQHVLYTRFFQVKVTSTKWRNKDRIVAQAYHFYVNYDFYTSSWIEDKKVPSINVMAEICFWSKTFKTSSFFTFFCLVFIITIIWYK